MPETSVKWLAWLLVALVAYLSYQKIKQRQNEPEKQDNPYEKYLTSPQKEDDAPPQVSASSDETADPQKGDPHGPTSAQ